MRSARGTVGIASLAGRGVHIRTSPSIRNIRESREVLRLLKTYGEVVSFRNLRYDHETWAPSTIVAVFQNPESARKLIADSPLSIAVDSLRAQALKRPGLATTLAELHAASLPPEDGFPSQPSAEESLSHATLAQSPREIVLHVGRSDENHYGRIRRQEFYWGSGQEPNRTMVQDDLAANVPLDGLAMIKASPVSLWSRVVNAKQDEVDSKKTLRQLYEDGNKSEQATEPSNPND